MNHIIKLAVVHPAVPGRRHQITMKTSLHGRTFCIIGPLWPESIRLLTNLKYKIPVIPKDSAQIKSRDNYNACAQRYTPGLPKSKLQLLKIAKNWNCKILQDTLHVTHLLRLLDKIYKYEMDSTKTVGATERTRDAGRTDGVKPSKSSII